MAKNDNRTSYENDNEKTLGVRPLKGYRLWVIGYRL